MKHCFMNGIHHKTPQEDVAASTKLVSSMLHGVSLKLAWHAAAGCSHRGHDGCGEEAQPLHDEVHRSVVKRVSTTAMVAAVFSLHTVPQCTTAELHCTVTVTHRACGNVPYVRLCTATTDRHGPVQSSIQHIPTHLLSGPREACTARQAASHIMMPC